MVINRPELSDRFRSGSAAIVDIAPSVLQHLDLVVPVEVAARMDGVSLLRARNTKAPRRNTPRGLRPC
jgi:hypothetical protein